MWAVSNVACAEMRYIAFGEAPQMLAAAPLDARRVRCADSDGPRWEKRVSSRVTA